MPSTHLGGRYKARQHADGTLDIFDVPIVSELAKGERKDLPDFEITPDWLSAALRKAEARAGNGYLPPLHVHHHDDKTPSPRAGYFRPKHIGDLSLDGRPVKTLFADLLRIPKAVADRVKAGELPYRSIEILNVNAEPEIDSLALLDSQPPQFRYALGTIGQMVHAKTARLTPLANSKTQAVAFASFAGGAAKAAFTFRGASFMADKNNDGKKDKEKDEDEVKAATEGGEEQLQAAGDDAPGGAAPAPAAEAPPAWVDAMVQKIVDGVAAVCGKGAAAPAPIADEGDVQILSADADAGKPKFLDPTLEGSLVAKAAKLVEGKFTGMLSEQSGVIAGLKAQLAQRDKKDKAKEHETETEKLILSARRELRTFNLDEETLETDLPAVAKLGKEHLDRWVAGIKRVAPKDPSESIDSFSAEARDSDDPVVARFAAKGPDALASARAVAKHFETLKAASLLPRHMTLERYMACNEPMFAAQAGSRN